MIKVSTKSRYGLQAALYLARSQKISSIKEISRMENIPSDYLEKICQSLKRNGLIRAKKGKNGGYILARSPKKIAVGEIVQIFEGGLAPVFCVSKTKKKTCSKEKTCLSRPVWQKMQKSLSETLNSITLSDLLK